MQFGMFYEIQVRKPWHETKEFETYQQVLNQVQALCKLLDSRLRGNDVMPVFTGIQRWGGLFSLSGQQLIANC